VREALRGRGPSGLATRAGVVLLAVAVAALAARLLLHRLGAGSLLGDEARYAAVVAETRAAGGPPPWRLGGEPYVDKPPLGLLLLEASLSTLGGDERAARLPAAAAGFATALLLFALGARWSHPLAGAVAALLYVSAPTALGRHALRGATFDALLVLLVVAALAAWIESLRSGRPRAFRSTLALVAAATLVKSAVAAALVAAAVVAAELVLAARGAAPARRALGRCAALAGAGAAMLGLWIGVLLASGVPDAAQRLIGFDLLRRARSGVDPGHLGPASRYLDLAVADFGWALLLTLPLAAALASAWRRRDAAALVVPAALLAWPLAMVALLSASASKLPWYALPAWAGLALAAGAGAGHLARHPRTVVRLTAWAAALLLLAPGLTRALALVEAQETRVAMDRLGRILAEVPRARLWVDPGLALGARARHDPADRALLDDANAYYFSRLGAMPGWPSTGLDGGSCAVVIVARDSAPPLPGAPAGWRVRPLPSTPLAVADGCGGEVAARFTPRPRARRLRALGGGGAGGGQTSESR
jgi:4-amino-4-deoxy-L-arabinose transferase-like glycosyltransferase